MSKAIRSYPERERAAVIARRVSGKTGGLGYLAALDAQKRQAEKAKNTKIADAVAGEASA